jgi:hypothetical protein
MGIFETRRSGYIGRGLEEIRCRWGFWFLKGDFFLGTDWLSWENLSLLC